MKQDIPHSRPKAGHASRRHNRTSRKNGQPQPERKPPEQSRRQQDRQFFRVFVNRAHRLLHRVKIPRQKKQPRRCRPSCRPCQNAQKLAAFPKPDIAAKAVRRNRQPVYSPVQRAQSGICRPPQKKLRSGSLWQTAAPISSKKTNTCSISFSMYTEYGS